MEFLFCLVVDNNSVSLFCGSLSLGGRLFRIKEMLVSQYSKDFDQDWIEIVIEENAEGVLCQGMTEYYLVLGPLIS